MKLKEQNYPTSVAFYDIRVGNGAGLFFQQFCCPGCAWGEMLCRHL